MDILQTQEVTAVPRARAAAEPRPYLMVIAGQQVGELHKLTGSRTVIGRGSSATLRLGDDGISREHAELVVEADAGRVTVRDLGSTNGTFVNGARADGRALRDGDKLSIGGATLLVFTHQDGLERDSLRSLTRAAGRDPSTTALKREVFLERLGEEISFARRHGAPLMVLAWELDGFESLETSLGPVPAKALLAAAARAASGALIDDDLLALVASSRFAVACRETTPRQAATRVSRFRATIAAVPHTDQAFASVARDASKLRLTVSVGGAAVGPGEDRGGEAATILLAAAVAALDRARAEGGDRAVLPPDDTTDIDGV
jgi:two-component system, cell cycle response regulator